MAVSTTRAHRLALAWLAWMDVVMTVLMAPGPASSGILRSTTPIAARRPASPARPAAVSW
jgi:hypothetical protein